MWITVIILIHLLVALIVWRQLHSIPTQATRQARGLPMMLESFSSKNLVLLVWRSMVYFLM